VTVVGNIKFLLLFCGVFQFSRGLWSLNTDSERIIKSSITYFHESHDNLIRKIVVYRQRGGKG
jgi:hypothetical protein